MIIFMVLIRLLVGGEVNLNVNLRNTQWLLPEGADGDCPHIVSEGDGVLSSVEDYAGEVLVFFGCHAFFEPFEVLKGVGFYG